MNGAIALGSLGGGPLRLRPRGLVGDLDGELAPWEVGEAQPLGSGWRWAGPGFTLSVEVELGADAVQVQATLEAERPLQLGYLGFELDAAILGDTKGLRLFRQGYASWTPAASLPWDEPPGRPLSWSFAVANHAVDSPGWASGGMASHGYTLLGRAGEGLLVGWRSSRVGLGEILLGPEPSLAAVLDYGGRTLSAGERLGLEGLHLAWGPLEALHERYLDEVAREHRLDADRLAREPVISGWCSWYHFYTKVRPQDVIRNADGLRALEGMGLSLVQLDDGYQAAVGDWREMNAKFAGGLGPLAREIAARGFVPGLWTAPFMVGRRSRLYREHPGWILREDRGRPIDCGLNPAWMDRVVGLDLSHPDVQGWLHALFRGLYEDGFRFFKLDFLYAALRHAPRHDRGVSPVQSYRRGLEIIRDAVKDSFVLGCGAPLLPSVGLVDGMRVSADVKEAWGPGIIGIAGEDCGAASLRESARNNLTRAALHRRWWLNDPDCLLVRDRNTALDLDEVRLLVTVAGMTGGLGIVSDDLGAVPEDRRALLASVLPPTPLRPRCPDLFERPFPERFELEGEGRRLVAALNWEARPRTLSLEDAPVWRFDAWERRPLPPGPLVIPRHGVRAWWETPRAERPRLVGTDLHLTGPVDGRISERLADGALRLRREGLPPRAGRLWIALPRGWEPGEIAGPARILARWEEGVVLGVEAGWGELRLGFRA